MSREFIRDAGTAARCGAYVRSKQYDELWLPCTRGAVKHGGKLALCAVHAEAFLEIAFALIEHGICCFTDDEREALSRQGQEALEQGKAVH